LRDYGPFDNACKETFVQALPNRVRHEMFGRLSSMKYLAWFPAALVVAAGVAGLVAPDTILSLRSLAATQGALLVFAAVRVAIGVLLIMAAPRSRAPRTLQIAGAVLLLVGLATPLFGVERTRAVLAWEAAQGPSLIRLGGAIVVVLGGLLAVALRPLRQ